MQAVVKILTLVTMRTTLMLVFILQLLFTGNGVIADTGYQLWLRYHKIEDEEIMKKYSKAIKSYWIGGNSATTEIIKSELTQGLAGLFARTIPEQLTVKQASVVITK